MSQSFKQKPLLKIKAELSLIEFAEQANLTFILPFDVVMGKRIHQIKGVYTVSEALNIMLKSTGLKAHVDEDGQLIIIIDDQYKEAIEKVKY